MKELIEDIQADSIIWRGTLVTLLLIILSGIYIAVIYRELPPIIPLFNQLPWGEERLSERIGIFLPLAFIVCAFVINSLIATMIHKSLPLVARILAITTVFLTLIMAIFLIKTTFLII